MRRFGSRCGAICKVVLLIKSKKGRGWRPILPLCQQQLPQLSPQPQLLLLSQPHPQPLFQPMVSPLLQHSRIRMTIHHQLLFRQPHRPLLLHIEVTSDIEF